MDAFIVFMSREHKPVETITLEFLDKKSELANCLVYINQK